MSNKKVRNLMKHNQTGQMQMKVDFNKLDSFLCVCGEGLFIKGEVIKKVPGLLSPNGLPGMAEIATAKICYKCGKIYSTQEILDEIKNGDAIKPVIVAP